MKRLLLLLFCAQIAYGQPNSVTRNYYSGMGPVSVNDGLGRLNSAIWRDSLNRISKEIQYHEHNNVHREISNEYNKQGQLLHTISIEYPKHYWTNLEKEQTAHQHSLPDTSFTSYIYANELLSRKIIVKRSRKDTTELRYYYNNNKLISEIKTIDQWGRNAWRELRYYKDGKLSSKSYWRGTNYAEGYKVEPSSYVRFDYDKRGLLTKELWLKDSLVKRGSGKVFKYTEFDSIQAEGSVEEDGRITWNKEYQYDKNMRCTSLFSGAYKWTYKYDKKGYLIETQSHFERTTNENITKYIYEGDNLIREESHYGGKMTAYEELFYSKTGKLIRRQPIKHEHKEALDWIKKFYYNNLGQLSREEYIHPRQYNYMEFGSNITIGINESTRKTKTVKPDPYKNYEHTNTYYEYDNDGEISKTYVTASPMTIVILSDSGYTRLSRIDPYQANVLFGNNVDTIHNYMKGNTRIVTFTYNKMYPPYSNHLEIEGDRFLHAVKRTEHKNLKGEIIKIVEYDKKGQLLCSYVLQDDVLKGKRLSTFIIESDKQVLHYYVKEPITRLQVIENLRNGKVYQRIEPSGRTDTIYYEYANGKLFRDFHVYGGGSIKQLTEHSYDANGFKTQELVYDENGVLSYATFFKNDGKHIVERNRQSKQEGNLIRNVIEYF